LSPIESYALTIVNGLGAQNYGTDWFNNGGFPPGTFKNSAKTVSQEEAEAIRARLVASIRARKPLVHGCDWEYSPVTVPPEQAQFIETLKMTANQVAAIYGIAPDEIGGEAANSLTYANEEHRETRRIADVRPWLVRFESVFSSMLPERQYVKFAADAVVRADLTTRYGAYKIAREIGLLSINEERALEDLPPVPGGNVTAPPAAPVPSASPIMQPVSTNGHTTPARALTP
jgi:HK97 family phage portal protein